MSEKNIIYADGSSAVRNNKRCGGIGVYFENTKDEIYETYTDDNSTNQRMELQACLTAIRQAIEFPAIKSPANVCIVIRTDSMYSINCITKWSIMWEKNNWMRKVGKNNVVILHLDLIKELYGLYNMYNIKFEHVRAHMKEPTEKSEKWSIWNGNNIADRLASCGMNRGFLF